MSVTIAPDSSLMNTMSGIEERQCQLISRHSNLRDKIVTMERSIPALMAYNMWMSERDCSDAPYRKVREIMSMFSPHPDPADRLVAQLRTTVNHLRQETAQLHDKIVDADVKLEETDMELESLELANKETEERLMKLRNDTRRHGTLSLHSIHSDDLLCLKKIRRLADEELKLKNCIEQLENKEITYRRQMNKLFTCKKYQRRDNRHTERGQRFDKDGGPQSPCLLDCRRCDVPAEKTKENCSLKDQGRKTRCPRATPNTTFNHEETSKKKMETREELRPLQPCCIPLDNHATVKNRYDCRLCCGACREIPFRPRFPCESLLSVTASRIDVRRSGKLIEPPAPACDSGKTCKECRETPAACKRIGNCMCAYELSTLPLDCNVTSSWPKKTAGQLPPVSRSLRSLQLEADDSNSDDEFCECCSCD